MPRLNASYRAIGVALGCGALAVGVVVGVLFRRDATTPRVDAVTPAALARAADAPGDAFGANDDPARAMPQTADTAPRRSEATPDRNNETRLRNVTGSTRRADSGLFVRCAFQPLNDDGSLLGDRIAANSAVLFRLNVDARAAKLRVTAESAFDLDPVTIPLHAGDVGPVVIDLPRAQGILSGRVVDESGRGVDGIRVRVLYGRAFRTTNADGSFDFSPVRDDTYPIDLEREAFSTCADDNVQQVAVANGAQSAPILFTVRRGSTLRVRVIDGVTKQPVAGVSIGVATIEGRSARRDTPTGADGCAEIRHLVAGTYDVAARPREAAYSRSSMRVTDLRDDETRTVDLAVALGAGELDGKVEAPDGSPQPFARLVALPEPGSSGTRTEARTDSAGAFVFRGLPPGSYRVHVEPTYCRSFNWLPATSEPIAVEAGKKVSTHVRMRQGARIDGLIVTRSPRKALRAKLSLPDGSRLESQIADDRFAFGGLDPGFYRVEVIDSATTNGAVLYTNGVQVVGNGAESVRVELP